MKVKIQPGEQFRLLGASCFLNDWRNFHRHLIESPNKGHNKQILYLNMFVFNILHQKVHLKLMSYSLSIHNLLNIQENIGFVQFIEIQPFNISKTIMKQLQYNTKVHNDQIPFLSGWTSKHQQQWVSLSRARMSKGVCFSSGFGRHILKGSHQCVKLSGTDVVKQMWIDKCNTIRS